MNLLAPAAARPLLLRRRRDLAAQRMAFGRRSYWNVKDPLSLRFYQLREEEYFILQQLDGRTGLEEIQRRFHARFAPRRIELAQLQWFLAMLHRQGLVITDAPEQGQRLFERRRRLLRQRWAAALTNVLAIRFRGVNPQPLLDALYPAIRWLFSPLCVAAGLLLIVAAVLLLLVELPLVVARLPALAALLTAGNLFWLAVALAIAKVLHEMGHALVCRHFGGQCRELGVMLLVFVPCLYCNTTDAWMLPSKWRRMAVSAAGIYVELVLAAACTFLWWFSEPGLLNTICLNLMILCSLSTLLFNGNPLLRYDGYFILADAVEMPNLAQRAGEAWRGWLLKWLAGVEARGVPAAAGGERWVVAVYGVASLAYRWALVLAILWFCHAALKPYGLELLARLLAVVVITGMLAMPLWQAAAFFRDPAWSRRLKWPRLAASGLLAVAVLTGICLLPLPHRITAPVLLEAADASRVYVTVPGRLVAAVQPGDAVAAGDQLVALENVALQKEVAVLEGQLAVQQIHVEHLKGRRLQDQAGDVTGAGGQLPAAEEALQDLRQRLLRRRAEQARLTVTAPAPGTVLPVRARRAEVEAGELPSWDGSPLDLENLGSYLETGTELCWIGDPQRLEARLVVDQADIALVREGQRVRLQVDELQGAVLTGRVVQIAQRSTTEAPPELVAKRLIALRADDSPLPQLAQPAFEVRVQLDPHDHPIPLRAAGRAKILVDSRTLAARAYDYLCRTFRIDL